MTIILKPVTYKKKNLCLVVDGKLNMWFKCSEILKLLKLSKAEFNYITRNEDYRVKQYKVLDKQFKSKTTKESPPHATFIDEESLMLFRKEHRSEQNEKSFKSVNMKKFEEWMEIYLKPHVKEIVHNYFEQFVSVYKSFNQHNSDSIEDAIATNELQQYRGDKQSDNLRCVDCNKLIDTNSQIINHDEEIQNDITLLNNCNNINHPFILLENERLTNLLIADSDKITELERTIEIMRHDFCPKTHDISLNPHVVFINLRLNRDMNEFYVIRSQERNTSHRINYLRKLFPNMEIILHLEYYPNAINFYNRFKEHCYGDIYFWQNYMSTKLNSQEIVDKANFIYFNRF